MSLKQWGIALTAAAILSPLRAVADDTGFFAGLDISTGMASGSSDTTDGGAAFAGGGIVRNVNFGETLGIGGHAGYRFSPALAAFVSYEHIRGDVNWDVAFPAVAGATRVDGTAISDALMANLSYSQPLSGATSFTATAGLGVSFNSLSQMTERGGPSNVFVSNVDSHTKLSPAAEIGVGIDHGISPGAVIGLNLSIAYSGGFETGKSRLRNLGLQPITPYRLDDVWRTSLGASLRFEF